MLHHAGRIALIAIIAAGPLAGCRQSPPATQPDASPPLPIAELSQIGLSAAIDHWVHLIDSDQLSQAQAWCLNDSARQELAAWWQALRQGHEQFNYGSWSLLAANLKRAPARFTVGGHEYGCMHTVWEPTLQGWRIARVFVCR